ncbi:MAG: ATP-binding cassette domain-containing protein [Paracoccaceae bacterium]
MTDALRVRDLTHDFAARRALDAVSLGVPEGAFVALLGPNGAGKTTLFNLVTRLYAARTGTIEVCGVDLRARPRAALSRLGVVFQSRALDANLSVAQNLAYMGALHGLPAREARARGEALMARMALADRMGDKVRALSGGQARRAEIAAALLHRPRLLLCDEATVGLDVAARADVVADIHRLASEEGVGVLWATHLTDEIEPADRVVVLHRGRVRASGTASGIAGAATLSDAFLALTGAGVEATP